MWVTGGVPVTHLRKMMLEELQRRNYAQHTTRSYIRTVEDFARRFNCPPDRLGPRHIREFQAELFQKRKLSPGTVAVRLAALRFFYIKTLKKGWSIAETPFPGAGGVERHEQDALARSARRMEELRDFFLAKNRRQVTCPFRIRSLGDAPTFFKRLNVKKP